MKHKAFGLFQRNQSEETKVIAPPVHGIRSCTFMGAFWLCAEMNPSRQEKSSQNQVKIAMKLKEEKVHSRKLIPPPLALPETEINQSIRHSSSVNSSLTSEAPCPRRHASSLALLDCVCRCH